MPFVPRQDVISTVLDGEAVLLNVVSGQYYSLDPVATRIWELLGSDRALTDDQLVAQLGEEFDVAPGVLAVDVPEFLHALADAALIESS